MRLGMVDDEPFAVAAIWDRWGKGTGVLHSFAVMTIFPDELMATIHDRMPVIIDPKDYYRWLEPGDPERPLLDLLLLCHALKMKAWTVTSRGYQRGKMPSHVLNLTPVSLTRFAARS